MESMRNFEARRGIVYRLLREGTGDKMLLGRSKSALPTLLMAYERARDPTPLLPPMFQVTAYRLANALFRSASTKDELERVNRLLIEATSDQSSVLGPMPHIHRVAVLSRLRTLEAGNTNYTAESEVAYEAACTLARRAESATHTSKRRFFEAKIQGQVHNLLELTAYYTGFNYERRVGGLSSPFEDLRLDDEWKVVGTNGVNESVRYSEDFARAELEARGSAGVDLLFRLGIPKNRSKHDVWNPGSGKRKRYGRYPLLLLTALCRRPCTDEQLFAAAHGAVDFDSATLANDKRDLRDMLQECLQRPGLDVLPKADLGQPLQLASDVRIAGMVFDGAE